MITIARLLVLLNNNPATALLLGDFAARKELSCNTPANKAVAAWIHHNRLIAVGDLSEVLPSRILENADLVPTMKVQEADLLHQIALVCNEEPTGFIDDVDRILTKKWRKFWATGKDVVEVAEVCADHCLRHGSGDIDDDADYYWGEEFGEDDPREVWKATFIEVFKRAVIKPNLSREP